jgi:hypothetical protein
MALAWPTRSAHFADAEARAEGLGDVPVTQVVQPARDLESAYESAESVREQVQARQLRTDRMVRDVLVSADPEAKPHSTTNSASN